MEMRKRITAPLLLALLMVCTACGEKPAEPAGTESAAPLATEPAYGTEETTGTGTTAPETQDPALLYYGNFCTFGDSIAYGYGLSDPMNQRFSALLAQTFGAKQEISEYNFGVNGDDSSDLVTLLTESCPDDLGGADLVVLSIGANNLLGVTAPYLSQISEGKVDELLPVVSSPEFNQALLDGIARLEKDIPTIVSEIRKSAPDAEIVWMTVYNPFTGVKFETKVGEMPYVFDLGTFTESYLLSLNAKITEKAGQLGYTVADVYTAFKESTAKNVNVTVAEDGRVTDIDPHPNADGHALIAQTLFETVSKKANYFCFPVQESR